MIYLDHAATTPLNHTAAEVFVNVATHYFGNPSSLHDAGAEAKQLLDASRRTLAKILHCSASEVLFTGGGSEANQLAIQALLASVPAHKNEIITSTVEHSSIRNYVSLLESKGYKIIKVPVNDEGLLQLDILKKSISEHTALVSIQHANSETGVIQDVAEISAICRNLGTLLHSDCVQTFCKIDVDASFFDAISISAHKIYGPKGVGAVYINDNIEFKPLIPSTKQEKGLRAGTENVAGIASFATAAKLLYAERSDEFIRITDFKQSIIERLKSKNIDFKVEGSNKLSLPHILGLRFKGIEGQYLMLECSQTSLAISTGSACQAGSQEPNRTMKAMNKSDEDALEFVRFSFGKQNSMEQIDVIIDKIATILTRHLEKIKF